MFFNDDYLGDCGGVDGDSEDSKECTHFIQNSTEKNSGIYSCVSWNQIECTEDTLTLVFKEPSPPRFQLDLPRQLNVSAGGKANLSCNASGIPRPFITWFKDGRRVPSSSVRGVKGYSMLAFDSVHLNDQGEYWCEANSTEGWNRSSTANVTVLWRPVFTIHPKSAYVYIDDGVATVTFLCEASGLPRPVIATLVIAKRKEELQGMMAPSFYIHPKSIRASHDGTVKFKCAARGFPRPNIAWLKDRAEFKDTSAKMVQRNMNESSELIMTILSVSDRHVGYYACLATILDTHVSSREAELSFKDDTVPTGSVSKIVWSSVVIGVVFLVVIIVLIVFMRKRRKGTSYQINKEIIKKQQEFIQLQITNNKDTINKLRNSHPIVCDNTQDDAAQSTADENDVVNNEMYLQGMAVDRNWEIPRDRLTITEEKLGGGEFGIVNKGLYLRTDGNELPVAVKRLKGWYWSYSWLGGECS
ncbi:hypothetical protein OS493_011217 [Desmophyllum pertusum]|uniref:Ig-like domain-containing protein n=1 Tax=Desmophyllum pertusum TaxID=174260 RepID=A0A9W9Z1Y9_9CNID|nr:hypothetical protein OS493_011217 [Desmophyllum pertusum]